jgi:DNA excision repair protein ERCC-4
VPDEQQPGPVREGTYHRGRHYELSAVVVEATLADVCQGRYRSEIKPHAALQSIITFQIRYRTGFIWAGNRQAAEYCTFWLLSKFLREIEERYKQAMKGQKNMKREAA